MAYMLLEHTHQSSVHQSPKLRTSKLSTACSHSPQHSKTARSRPGHSRTTIRSRCSQRRRQQLSMPQWSRGVICNCTCQQRLQQRGRTASYALVRRSYVHSSAGKERGCVGSQECAGGTAKVPRRLPSARVRAALFVRLADCIQRGGGGWGVGQQGDEMRQQQRHVLRTDSRPGACRGGKARAHAGTAVRRKPGQ